MAHLQKLQPFYGEIWFEDIVYYSKNALDENILLLTICSCRLLHIYRKNRTYYKTVSCVLESSNCVFFDRQDHLSENAASMTSCCHDFV